MATSVTRKLKKQFEIEYKIQELKIDEAFQDILRQNEMVNSDMVYDECIKRKVPVKILAAVIPGIFKRFKKAGLIKKLRNYSLSNRSSKPLPWYVSQLYKPDGRRGGLLDK